MCTTTTTNGKCIYTQSFVCVLVVWKMSEIYIYKDIQKRNDGQLTIAPCSDLKFIHINNIYTRVCVCALLYGCVSSVRVPIRIAPIKCGS